MGENFPFEVTILAERVNELDPSFRCQTISLHDRQKIVLKGPIGKRNSLLLKPKPFSSLQNSESELALGRRGIYEGKTKKELNILLDESLYGVPRVPALLCNNPNATLESLNLGGYEVLPCEPMRDISHQIELPAHIEDVSCRKKLAVRLTTGKKGTKRAVDYPQCSLITTSCYVRGTASPREQHLLDTMVDIQDILYRQDKFRSPRLILRFHNSSWYHHTFCPTCPPHLNYLISIIANMN